ncbi:MAG: hypothetical protein ACOYXB_13040 [Bacteroidota bacterium]
MKKFRVMCHMGCLLVLFAGPGCFFACERVQYPPEEDLSSVSSCVGCHTNYAYLQKVYSPDTTAVVSGCGGDAPHYEPYDRVFMGGTGYDAYKASSHYYVGCKGCHNGNDHTPDKTKAHSGDFISHPSSHAEEKCGACHEQIVATFATALHNGTGQKRKVTMRSGLAGPEEFDQLPAHQIEGYTNKCSTCHGTCGNCHIVRPPIAGGGLAKGHAFTKTPDMVTVCVSCHESRGGHAYLGVASGTVPDVHLKEMGYKCLDCHDGSEMHGDGTTPQQRYAYAELPKCEDCHDGIATANSYHTQHFSDFNCQVCHSQDYNNCGSCHVNAEGARVPSYLSFKIAVNPLPDIKSGYRLALVRRTLAAPDNWSAYGVEDYSNFDAFPTYNYTTPHNILRWTSRTTVEEGQSCSASCHLRVEGDTVLNRHLYLMKGDLLDWEHAATDAITMDDQLPGDWML